MRKVREKILSKQTSVELSEKMRKLRELKKYGKKVQQEVLLKRQKEKKNLADSVKKYRKGVQDKLEFMKSDDFGGIEAEDEKKRGKNNNNSNNKNISNKPHQPNRKRVEKNKKFGHGGQKKRGKYNTADSAADPSSGPKGKGKKFPGEARGGGGRGGGKAGGGPKNQGSRPGKSKRVSNKNKKK